MSTERSLIRSSYTSLPRSGINIVIPNEQNNKRQFQPPTGNRATSSTLPSPRKSKLSLIEGLSTLERQRQAAQQDSFVNNYDSVHGVIPDNIVSPSSQEIPTKTPTEYRPVTTTDRYITYSSSANNLPTKRASSTFSNDTAEDNLPNGPPNIKQLSRLNSERSINDYPKHGNVIYDAASVSSRGQSKYKRDSRSIRSASQDGYGEGLPDYQTLAWATSRDSRNFTYDTNRRQSDQLNDQDQLSIGSRGHIILVSDRPGSGRRKNSARSSGHPSGMHIRDDGYHVATLPSRDHRSNRHRLRDDPFDSSGYISVAQRPSRQPSVTGRISSATSSVRSAGSSQKYSLTIEDAVNMLKSDNPMHCINAAAHLQHACFNNDQVKATVKHLGAIPHLVRMVDNDNEEVQLSAIATLRNLAYGKANDESKAAIFRYLGISVLANVLKRTGSPHVREEIARLLWNLSTLEIAKEQMLNLTLDILAKLIDDHSVSTAEGNLSDTQWPTIYANATGTLRNLSSTANLSSRQMMRRMDRLMIALLSVIHSSVQRKDYDSKCVENSVCILRNLSYNLEEEVDDGLDIADGYKKIKHKRRSIVSKMFSDRKSNLAAKSIILSENNRPVKGVAILWQTSTIEDYLALLFESRNVDTLEAVAGAIHNLTACNWRFSGHIRYVIRREKGIEILTDLLQFDDEKVFAAIVTALNNLALDEYNKDIIGELALNKLMDKLPGRNSHLNLTDISLCCLLKTLCVLMYKNNKNVHRLMESGVLPHLTALCMVRSGHGKDIIKAANSLLFTLWQNKSMRSSIKKANWDLKSMKKSLKESANLPDVIHVRSTDIPDTLPDEQDQPDQSTTNQTLNTNNAHYGTMTRRSKSRSEEYPHDPIPENDRKFCPYLSSAAKDTVSLILY